MNPWNFGRQFTIILNLPPKIKQCSSKPTKKTIFLQQKLPTKTHQTPHLVNVRSTRPGGPSPRHRYVKQPSDTAAPSPRFFVGEEQTSRFNVLWLAIQRCLKTLRRFGERLGSKKQKTPRLEKWGEVVLLVELRLVWTWIVVLQYGPKIVVYVHIYIYYYITTLTHNKHALHTL